MQVPRWGDPAMIVLTIALFVLGTLATGGAWVISTFEEDPEKWTRIGAGALFAAAVGLLWELHRLRRAWERQQTRMAALEEENRELRDQVRHEVLLDRLATIEARLVAQEQSAGWRFWKWWAS